MANILVVDDEIGIRELLSEILNDEGHAVFLAENASRARLVKQEESLDLVLLDIWMPDTDGVTLLKEWASAGQLTCPVIMMSGHATIDTAVQATRIGAMDFLEKPIALQKLLKAVQAGLSRAKQPAVSPSPPPSLRPNTFVATPTPATPPANNPPYLSSSFNSNSNLINAAMLQHPAISSSLSMDTETALKTHSIQAGSHILSLDQPLREARDAFERVYFEHHLARENYSMTRVAERTGLERTHLYRKLKQLGIELGRSGRRSGE